MQTSFESRIKNCLASNVKQALPTWLEYIEWIQGEIEDGKKTDSDLSKQIERCCIALENQEYYRNDKSYLRLWITYADMASQEIKTFHRLKEKKIGATLALFYEAWATVLETNGDILGAHRVLCEGKLTKTTPEGHLAGFLESFQERNGNILNKAPKPVVVAPVVENGVNVGYDRSLVYPCAGEEYSFEEIRARNYRGNNMSNDSLNITDSIHGGSLNISNISLNKENHKSKPTIRQSLAAVLHKPVVSKKDITLHTKQAEQDILDMFGQPLDDDTFESLKHSPMKTSGSIKNVSQTLDKENAPKKRKTVEVFQEDVTIEKKKKKLDTMSLVDTLLKVKQFVDLRGSEVVMDSEGILQLGTDQFMLTAESYRGKFSIYSAQDSKGDMYTIKYTTNQNGWECYIFDLIKYSKLKVFMYKYYLYRGESYLVDARSDYGSLMSLIQLYKKQNKLMDEHISIYYTIEILKTLEILHNECGIVHGNISPEHFLILNENSPTWENWSRNVAPGWETKGLVLADYEDAIDMRLQERSCQIEMRKDIEGVCNVIHWLIHGEPIELVQTDKIQTKSTLKRYMQVELWGNLFDSLLNHRESLSNTRRMMEDYLTNNPRKSSVLKSLLSKQNVFIKSQ